jgi:hypothetical protein
MKLIGDARSYRSFVVPLGLFQVIRDRNRFNPEHDEFDPVLLLEYASNPLHYTVNRGDGGGALVRDLVNGRISRNLNAYRGFVPAGHMVAEGLAAPTSGYTLKLSGSSNERLNGIFVGAGPYLSARTSFNVDENLRQILASNTDVRLANSSFGLTDTSSGQGAISLTLGYRGHIPLPGDVGVSSAPAREGIYFSADYHHLLGLRYDSADMAFRFDTDSSGLVTLSPTTIPAVIDHSYSNSGRGFALDMALGVVANRWSFGFGANGIANRMDWKDVAREQWTVQNLLAGADFSNRPLPDPGSTLRVKLPVDYVTHVAYDVGDWTVASDFTHGFRGNNFHGGVERRFGPIALRGGTRYSLEQCHPAASIGFNLTHRIGIDVAAFDTTTNVERERKASLALSLRLNELR